MLSASTSIDSGRKPSMPSNRKPRNQRRNRRRDHDDDDAGGERAEKRDREGRTGARLQRLRERVRYLVAAWPPHREEATPESRDRAAHGRSLLWTRSRRQRMPVG